ncbi:hypothetical protein [Kribbella sp. NPDC055071]
MQYSRNPSRAYTGRPADDDPSTPYSATASASRRAAYVMAAPIPRRRDRHHEVHAGNARAEEDCCGRNRSTVDPTEVVAPRIAVPELAVDGRDPARFLLALTETAAERLLPDRQGLVVDDAGDLETGYDGRRDQLRDPDGHPWFAAAVREAGRGQPLAEVGRTHRRADMPAAGESPIPQLGKGFSDHRVGVVEVGLDHCVVVVERGSADRPSDLRCLPLLSAAGTAHRHQQLGRVVLDRADQLGVLHPASLADQSKAARWVFSQAR